MIYDDGFVICEIDKRHATGYSGTDLSYGCAR